MKWTVGEKFNRLRTKYADESGVDDSEVKKTLSYGGVAATVGRVMVEDPMQRYR